jgi:hypothetical protein
MFDLIQERQSTASSSSARLFDEHDRVRSLKVLRGHPPLANAPEQGHAGLTGGAMEIYFRMMHSTSLRAFRVLGGFCLALYGTDLSPVPAFMVVILGTAIAVTGIADICPAELIVEATRSTPSRPQRRAA